MNSIFILGAGFSRHVGMPLTNELFKLILDEAKTIAKQRKVWQHDQTLASDIERFLDYYNSVNKQSITQNDINFEDFLSFLDIEHFLRLRGKKHWSEEGNKSQLIIKNIISKILYEIENKFSTKETSES